MQIGWTFGKYLRFCTTNHVPVYWSEKIPVDPSAGQPAGDAEAHVARRAEPA